MNKDTWDKLTINLRIKDTFNRINSKLIAMGYIEIKSDDITITRYRKGDHIVDFCWTDGSLHSW